MAFIESKLACLCVVTKGLNVSGRIDEFGVVSVHPPAEEKGKVPLLFQLHSLMQMLPDVIVQGIPTVERAIVNKDKDQ